MSLLNKLNKKDAVKFQFTLTIESIDNFYPHGKDEEQVFDDTASDTSSSSSSSSRRNSKRKSVAISPSDSKRKSIREKLSSLSGSGGNNAVNGSKPTASECSYSIFWKRGAKRNGKTSFVPYRNMASSSSRRNRERNTSASVGGRLRVNDVFNFTGTLFQAGGVGLGSRRKKSGKFLKKKLKFDLHERLLTDDVPSNTGEKIASAEVNLADFVEGDHEGETSQQYLVELDFGKGKGMGSLVISITSSISDDPATSTMSTYSDGDSDEASDNTDTDWSSNDSKNGGKNGKGKQKSAAVSVLESENADLREQVLYMKRKIEELEILRSGKETDSADLVIDLQKERDSLRQRLKLAQIECDQMREERDQASKEARARARASSIGSKLGANIKGITSKIGLTKQDTEDESYQSVDQTVERMYELEKENLKLKQQVKLLTGSNSSLVPEEKDEEKEKLMKQVADLRKKVATLEWDNKKDNKRSKNGEGGSNNNKDPISLFLEEELTSFLNKEVIPLLPNILFKTQQHFTHADISAAQLSFCKTLMTHGFLNESFFFKMMDKLDKKLFKLLLTKKTLDTSDGFKAKMAISVLEQLIVDVMGEDRMDGKSTLTFQRTRQCADICVLHKANVLKSDEMRKLVCPNLSFEQVKLICQKLGLVKS